MIPSKKISQTILEFGTDLICQLPDGHSKNELENVAMIVVSAWNAVVIDSWEGGNNMEAQLLKSMETAPKQAQSEIKRLIKRKKTKFGNDPRAVGNYWVREDNGSFVFGCEARGNVEHFKTEKTQH
jgi:hypothetical protein